MESNNETLTDKVENRLNELFDESQLAEGNEQHYDRENYPLRVLKAMMLSIDWEITDEVVGRFIDQVERLHSEFQNDKATTVLLRILGSLATHLKLRKAMAHPQTITMLKTTFGALESVILGDAQDTERTMVAQKTLQQFKTLQKENAQRRASQPNAQAPMPAQIPATLPEPKVDPQILEALSEIKQLIQNEFNHLRSELLDVINTNASESSKHGCACSQ